MSGRGSIIFADLTTKNCGTLSFLSNFPKLSAQKMQIHPHFLFNTLNSIVGLIQEDKNAAELMTTKLSEFLRMTLQNSGELMAALRQEFY